MILWRISNYATLDGAGGLYVSGRWHTKGQPIIYCTANPSTALLEILVHFNVDSEDVPEQFQVLKIEGPDNLSKKRIAVDHLSPNWANEFAETQIIGNQWLTEMQSLLLEVPSVLVPETWNVLVNPAHPDVKQLEIVATYDHPFDIRFFHRG